MQTFKLETFCHAMQPAQFNQIVKVLRKESDLVVNRDRETCTVTYNGKTVFRALKIRTIWNVKAMKGLLTVA